MKKEEPGLREWFGANLENVYHIVRGKIRDTISQFHCQCGRHKGHTRSLCGLRASSETKIPGGMKGGGATQVEARLQIIDRNRG